jgi:HEAT repeat protein
LRTPSNCLALACWGLIGIAGTAASIAAEPPSEEQLQLIIDLIKDKDRDMRALGLQQVREEAAGSAATKRFAALLPELSPDGQAGLIEALGDRGDPAAREPVLKLLGSQEAKVRAAVLRALGNLGTAADVPLLARHAAGETEDALAARRSLGRLRGEEIGLAIIPAMNGAEATARAALLATMAARGMREAMPVILQCAKDAEATVRIAALDALRALADVEQTAALVELVKAAGNEQERYKAELALMALCGRVGNKADACAAAIIAGGTDAAVPARLVLLRALARLGTVACLGTVVAALKDSDPAMRDEAARLLANWRDIAAAPHLLELARRKDNLRHHVLGIRGLVQLGGPLKDKPANLKLLGEALALAQRAEEKRLVLGALGGVPTAAAFEMVASLVADPAVAEETALAAVMIAEKLKGPERSKVRPVIAKIHQQTKNESLRQRAEKILQAAN